ncbi:hypothetical protein JCM10213_007781 [Rhodosporidiobolus nylandii]
MSAPQISEQDVQQQHPEFVAGEAKADIAAILSHQGDRASRTDAAKLLVDEIKVGGPNAFVREGVADAIIKALGDKKNAGVREAACELIIICAVYSSDEPTNYLDRESLAALISALKTFEGGVLVITHNQEFSESICTEVWAMRDGHLTASGHNWVEGQGSGPRIDKVDEEEKDVFDAMGNKIDAPKKVKKATSKDARKAKKERMARKKLGLPSDDEGDL